MTRTYLELLFATALWGFSFVASIWALQGMGPMLNTALRFGIALVFLALFSRKLKFAWREFLIVFRPSVCIFGMIAFQTWGLQTTSAGRSGFITVLYVLFVPIFERLFYRVRIKKILLLWIFVALVGTLLICGIISRAGVSSDFFHSVNLGDFLTFICALFGAAHIILVNQTMNKVDSSVKFHLYQCAWVFALALVTTAFTEGFHRLFTPWSPLVWLGMLHLGIFSSAIAFLIQVRAQKVIPPTQFGLLVLLESPWALCFSLVLGMEVITHFQILGAVLILLAAALESLSAFDFRSAMAKAKSKS